MKVLVCGARGCVGQAVVQALRSRGHHVVSGVRGAAPLANAANTWPLDFMLPVAPEVWAQRLRTEQIDAVVNCVGILMARQGQRFERVHALGPIELFQGASLAGVGRVVQVSALGAATGTSAYLASKRQADEALLALPVHATVLRPSLLLGPHCASTALLATLASFPVIGLPAGGQQRLQPLHVFELAEIVARCLERREPVLGAFEVGGAKPVSYRDMLAAYRAALGLHSAWWLPLPLAALRLGAWAAQALPQQVLCPQTLAMLEQGSVPEHNAAARLLGREPTDLAASLRVTPPVPLLDLRVQLSPAVATTMAWALASMWLSTAFISAWWPQRSGVLHLLARCGFEGDAAWAALALSCTLNAVMGLGLLWRPGPAVHALQVGAIVGYTAMAAWHMPELTLDHCGPLLKNLPVLAAVMLLWLAHGTVPAGAPRAGRHQTTAGCR
jgi:uncharacterized protein YbjT (DUF2867 family)